MSIRNFMTGIVGVATRGLLHSRTAAGIEFMLKGHRNNWAVRYTHELPIPEAQNALATVAMGLGVGFLLFIEEDIVPPPDLLDRFKPTLDAVQCVDYKLPGGSQSVSRNGDGSVLFCGLGCTLVPTAILRCMTEAPRFASDCEFSAEGGRLVLLRKGARGGYGKQDIYFSWRLQQLRVPIICIPDVQVAHLRVKERGPEMSNDGCHLIEAL